MSVFIAGALSAFWLGILTSISPCPLATNIAAISFIGKRVGNIPMVLLSGILYTLGRALTYIVVGIVVVYGLLSIPEVSFFLQKYMNKILGPVLVLVGLFLMEVIRIGSAGGGISTGMQEKVKSSGIWGAGLLGIVFALSLCPVSAALFFGSLIPLAIKQNSVFIIPSLYGIGTGLPVLFFAVLLAFSARTVGSAFRALSKIELWARRITGSVFILIGLYLTLKNIFGLPTPF
jgi:cytochrome c-type biogenesis protein